MYHQRILLDKGEPNLQATIDLLKNNLHSGDNKNFDQDLINNTE